VIIDIRLVSTNRISFLNDVITTVLKLRIIQKARDTWWCM